MFGALARPVRVVRAPVTRTTRVLSSSTLAPGDARGPRTLEGARALCKLAMVCYWDVGQRGFFDDAREGDAGVNFATPFGFEPLIGDGRGLRDDVVRAMPGFRALEWLDGTTSATTRAGVFRLLDGAARDWVIVAFRGTTPSPLRGLFRESQINGRAGQTTWAAGEVSGRVHSGYAEAYARVKSDIEDAVRREMDATGTANTKVVISGHSLGGALATLCAASLAKEFKANVIECVTFGQPRVGDKDFVASLDAQSLHYARVVHGGDLFARVPTSGFWLPTSNEGRFGLKEAATRRRRNRTRKKRRRRRKRRRRKRRGLFLFFGSFLAAAVALALALGRSSTGKSRQQRRLSFLLFLLPSLIPFFLLFIVDCPHRLYGRMPLLGEEVILCFCLR